MKYWATTARRASLRRAASFFVFLALLPSAIPQETTLRSQANVVLIPALLSFAPKNPHPGLHQIRVRLKDAGDATVLARSSYWAEGTK